MYNVYVKRIFVITEIVHMNEKTGTGISSEKENVKESQSRSVTPSLDTPSGAGLGHHTIPYWNPYKNRVLQVICKVNKCKKKII